MSESIGNTLWYNTMWRRNFDIYTFNQTYKSNLYSFVVNMNEERLTSNIL